MKQIAFLDAAVKCKDPKILIGKKDNKNQTICHYHILEKNKKELKRDPGDYFTIQFTDQVLEEKESAIEKEVEKIIKTFLKKYHNDHPILVVGLGNPKIQVDSFGSTVTEEMIATNQYNDFLTIPKVVLLNPEVMAKTGISSFKLIQLVVEDLKPDTIIIIDSLATEDTNSLNRVIEITDTGIIPGSALRTNKEINRNTFGIPILSIGIPFLYKTNQGLFESIHLKEELQKLSSIIAKSLNHSILF